MQIRHLTALTALTADVARPLHHQGMRTQTPLIVSQDTVPIGGLGQSAVTVQVGVQIIPVPIGGAAHLQPFAPTGHLPLQSASIVQEVGIIPSGGGIIPSGGGIIPSGGGIIPSTLQAVGPVCVQASARSG